MAIQFVNYSLDDFNTEQVSIENGNSIWNSVELYLDQNSNHSRMPNINHQMSFQPTFLYWRPSKELQSLQSRFDKKILMQFPSVPCLFYSILMFPTRVGFYNDTFNYENRQKYIDSYQKYIKHCLLSPNLKFCLHPYWPHWSYMNLEKICNHQNHSRILRQNNANRQNCLTAADLITTSIYNNKSIINENITTTLPSYIRTGNTYFKQKEHQVQTMVDAFQLPQIFYTTTMNENGWKHLKNILSLTDNKDTNFTNRSLHTYLHYYH